jgi:hypothetical protein
MIARALRKLAAQLIAMADEMDAGHIVASDELRTVMRRLGTQCEMMDEGIAE